MLERTEAVNTPTALVQIAPYVWHYPFAVGIQPSIGVIITNSETVLIDAGNSPKHAQFIEKELQALGAPPVRFIIYTHHHWDHSFGACHWNVPVIANERSVPGLIDYSNVPWSREYLQNEILKHPDQKASHEAKLNWFDTWDDFEVVLPEVTFEDQMTIKLDGISLELLHVGGQHADDSIVIHAVEPSVVFAGDAFYPPPMHLRKKTDTFSLEILNKMHNLKAEHYLHGHGEPIERSRLAEFILQLQKGGG